MKNHVTADPLLQPYQLKHLTLKNRVMTTSHEPAYPEDGMPKARYRAYHEERAKAGVALAMTAGSASCSVRACLATPVTNGGLIAITPFSSAMTMSPSSSG